jgi:TetR/AcrR family transcriptional regulator, mexJK operon transcriptional repressor
MRNHTSGRARATRVRLREAAYRLFLRQGYLATSVDSILAEAGVASKETLYRHYAGKEALFIDVLSHLTMDQRGFSSKVATLPTPDDLPALRQALTMLAREILTLMGQPGYLPLVRMILSEATRFPHLGALFFTTVTQRGISLIVDLLRDARERGVIADVDLEEVTYLLFGGLITPILKQFVLGGEAHPPPLAHADAVVELIMRALTP